MQYYKVGGVVCALLQKYGSRHKSVLECFFLVFIFKISPNWILFCFTNKIKTTQLLGVSMKLQLSFWSEKKIQMWKNENNSRHEFSYILSFWIPTQSFFQKYLQKCWDFSPERVLTEYKLSSGPRWACLFCRCSFLGTTVLLFTF